MAVWRAGFRSNFLKPHNIIPYHSDLIGLAAFSTPALCTKGIAEFATGKIKANSPMGFATRAVQGTYHPMLLCLELELWCVGSDLSDIG